MKLVEFSVTNYRSITKAHKIFLKDYTVLVGKNNEGKSNLLRALNVAMNAVILHSRINKNGILPRLYDRKLQYVWERDFPVQYQNRKSGLDSIFKLHFRLEDIELEEFHKATGIRGNEDIPIEVRIGKNGNPDVQVRKRGTSSYNRKSRQITEFISKRIRFNYIPAIRTEDMVIDALDSVIYNELSALNDNPEYIAALQKIFELQQSVLNNIANTLDKPLKQFLPSINRVYIRQDREIITRRFGRSFDIYIDDGVETSISNKGDGIKNLVTLAVLQNTRNYGGASVIAIEEPESHLHPGAIHSLVDVIHKISKNNQVIITTHNPLFVQQNDIRSNIIVDNGTAHVARNINEIRNTLGILPSDNLQNARYVLVVEGEDDKISLGKILPFYSEKIKTYLQNNIIVIKSLGGASNLSHDLADLSQSLCKYFVLLDFDKAGIEASKKAEKLGLITDSNRKFTMCNGSPEAEFEDALNPEIYKSEILKQFNVNLDVSEFRGNKKWSDRVYNVFASQGALWNNDVEERVKYVVATSIPERFNDIDRVIITAKAGFIKALAEALERMVTEEDK